MTTQRLNLDMDLCERISEAQQHPGWAVSIHYLHNGKLHHFFKASKKFPPQDLTICATAFREDAYKRRLNVQRKPN